ncbi:MAG TPA: non-ribosomal peptide synthase/polyketide synthase [Longimicrobium sp.]|jgi:amino acid adenylation domain-containing protein|uniref:non-ribosomal peptide synthase/polyketide synthase n=1 Tax=Longimicrobium sp. TaxID=2029185 RepID=UPI002ED8206E
MIVTPGSAGTLSRSEKQELLRKILLEKLGRPRTAPTSFAQERLWFIDRLEPGSAVYNLSVARRLEGGLNVPALERSLGEIVRRHESLRTTFGVVDGSPVQVVAPFGGFALPVEDLSGLGEEEREEAVARRAGEEARRPFDLAAGPLFRAALLRLGAEEHVLLLAMHHIVSDEWSSGVLFRELSALYAAYREGGESPLPELAVQYADYAAWQREQLAGETLDRQLAYWKEHLAGAPGLLELPTDHPRPAVQTFRGASVPVELSPELLAGLQALGRGEGATLYMTLLAAFQVLLGKYAGSDDVVVGSAIAGRTRAEVEALIGFFVNTLVLCTDLSGDPSFRELLGRVREATLGAYEHQEVPFERLVAELRPERSLSHSPLFQVVFTLQDGEGAGAALPGLRVSTVAAAREIAKFDLSLTLGASAQGLRGALNYSTDLFERGTVERMLGHLERVLEQVAADADVRLSRLELLSAEERGIVVEEWNRTDAEYPADRCIHELFEAQAARTPDAVAVEIQGETLSYAALNERANRLAHHLAGLDVGPEVRVGICLERGTEMIVSLLAVLKAGGAYVPLDPAYPAERLAFILADAAVRVLVTQESLLAALPAGDGVAVVSVDGDAERIAAESAENPERPVSPDHLAYVIYTSGSTGTPKGVMVPHRGVPNLAYAQARRFGIDGTSRVLQFASFSFDAAVAEVFDALLAGATLVMASREALLPGAGLLETLRGGRVTVATLPPPVLAILPPDDLPELRTVVSAGEAVDAATVARWSGGRAFVNAYGPTEVTVCATSAFSEADGRVPAIGRPLENVRVYVLGAAGRPAPVGIAGELYVGGVGVARGYQGRPGLTAERFVPDPFSVEGGARLYRTGDRVRWSARGELEFLGRVDAQVKVRGFRIEPGEIEARLRRSQGVADCVVVAREDGPGEKRLVAYVVGSVDAGILREHLLRELPEYMVPSAFVALDALPLTPNGKLDRKALPAPEGDAYARRGYEAPLGEVEAALAGVWAEVLGVEQVGRWDHFFELGGHSLLAIRLTERMRQAGLHTDVRALFTTPVLAELALAVGGASSEMEVPPNAIAEGCASITPEMLPLVDLSQEEIDRIVAAVPGGAANVQDIYPLAPLQDGFLFHHLMSEEGDPYLTSSMAEFDTRDRLDQYLAALQAVIGRHDILRTAMAWDGLREPVQVVWRHAPLPVDEVQLDADAEDAAGQLWRRYDPRHYRMDLGRAPLRRAIIAEDRARGRWVLLMLMHHLTGDHESLEVQREEISAHLMGRESELPAPLPFRNYVAQARLGVSREEHERFFRAMLGDVEEPTAPYGLLDVWREGHGIGEARLRVADDLSARLRRRARALGVSATSLWHLAWAQVLARLSGRPDVVFGTLLFGRMQGGEGTARVMGPFINTLPVRIGVGEEGAEAAVRRTHALLADLLRHEHASLALAQRSSGVAAPAPLFTSLLNYRHGAAPKPSRQAGQPGEGVRGIRVQERTNYPVVLSVDDLGEAFSLVAQVAAPADAEGMCRMVHTALERLVEALETAPGRAIGSLDVLPEAERRLVVEEWNRTDAKYPAHAPIHRLFEEQAERTPDAVAVRFGHQSLTYRELDARANRLAHHLVGLGAGPEVRVGICLERSLETVVATLAVLKSGGCCVPVDTSYPPERMALMLADSGARVLVSEGDLAAPLTGLGLHAVHLDKVAQVLAAEPDHPPRTNVAGENLAYVFYTSGSTGRPKGVMMAHREVVQYAAGLPLTMPIGPGDRVAQGSNASFDAAVFEIWGALVHGATLVGIDRDVLLSAPLLGQALREQGITHLYQTAALFNQHVREQADVYASLRQLVFGAEAVGTEGVRAMLRSGRPGRVLHEYGPTEATVWCTLDVVEEVEEDAATVPIGRPIPNARAYVLDPVLQPLPPEVAGELYMGGAGVVRGYLGRPGLTAERFVPDPFASAPGARMYRTGDRARWRADGKLEFMGRLDDQVKIRGFRIEPGEVEAATAAYPGVRQVRVIVREDQPGDKRLVAYVVGTVDMDGLRAHLRQGLPEYMVPRAIVALERLPLNANGKVDRKALPAPEYAAGADQYVAPRTPTEEVLAGVWAEVLGVERVGVEESFFELGGHSLLGTRVVSRVRGLFGVELPLRALFEGPTVAELAGRVEEMRRAGVPVLPPVVPAARTGALPLSFAQERLWFIDRLEPGSAVYNIPVARRLGGALDAAALERALGEIVRRHEALRTVFGEVDGTPVQVVAPFGGFSLPVEDLSGLGEADRVEAVRRRAGEEARRPFDLAAGPLFRAALLRLGAEEHVLLLTMHHIVSDGWSMGVLFRELSALHTAYGAGRESPLPELAVQYADYAVWQREQLAGEVLNGQLAYWKKRLAGAPELLELPTDRPRPPVQTYRGAAVPVDLSPELLERLRALGRAEGATLYMTLLSAFQVLLSKYGGGEDVVVGSPIAGRTRGEVEELIGFFVNTLVLRTDLSGDPSFREVLRRARDFTLGAYEHQDVPFEKLVTELQPERSLSYSPLFQVLFTLQNAEGQGDAIAGLEVRGIGAEREIAQFDLSLTLTASAQGLRGALNYSTDLFDRGTVERMLGHLERVLEQVAADADLRLSGLELLGDAEREQVLQAWNRTEAEYPADLCIHALFEAQAARMPNAVAVRFGAQSLTYAELNARANQLAHSLRGRGVGPEVRVGICLERGLEMVVAILAVLKAGGAYVPLDPGYPAERLSFILADSATPVLLTRETLRGALPALEGVQVVSLDSAAEEIAAESTENLASGAGPDSLAYVIYTSGSTGTPKGALIEHRNVARLFSATDAWFGFGPDDVWTLFHSYAFDFSVWELWGALLYGGRVVVVPFDVSRDPEAFHALVQRERVTVLNQTPSAFRQFIRADGERGGELALRVVVFGGEALEPASLREWVERRGIETPRLVNMYGITETTVHVTYRPLGREDVFGGSGSPIGRAIPDLRLYVLDPGRRPLPVGIPGELYVGGGGVARGYLNRPELTAERFVDDPFAPGRLYRSGDRVRWLADGTLDYLGRLDEQVKIRGFRIELGEIEAALRQVPGVTDCTVVVREDEPGDRRLVVYVVGGADVDALREHLRLSLPEYMVPSAFVALDALPLTANGKLDRKALPAPEGDAYGRRSYEAPLGEVETALAEIWAEVLGVERVGRWDHFFELGGHSLLAIKLIGRMRAAGLHTDVRALFTTSVLAELALEVGGAPSEIEVSANAIPEGSTSITPEMLPLVDLTQEEIDRIVAQVPGGAANVQDIYPLAPLQEGFLFHHLMSEEGDPYLVSSMTEFDTRARLDQYLAALQAVIDRHDILRTAIAWEGLREPVQVVWRHAPLVVDEVELDAGAGEVAGELLRRYDPRRHRMELGRAPLLRVHTAEDRASGRWVLLMLRHHLTGDHESLEVLQEEVTAHLLGQESELPAPLPFRNYVAQACLGVSRDEHERFFRAMLGDVEEPTAPYGLLDVWGEGRGIGEARIPVADELAARLRKRARVLGVSAASLCHLAWAQVLARLSGRQDVVFGTLLFGRMQGGEGAERVMGPFINTLPVRIGVQDDGAEAAVRRTHALLADLLRHEHASLALAQRSSGVAAPAPLFTSLLNYRHGAAPKRSRQARKGMRGVGAQERTNYPVVLSVDDLGEAFSLAAQVAAPVDAERVCHLMHTALERLVEALEIAPGRAVGSLDVLPEAERRQVVDEWNRTDAEYPAHVPIHRLFEEQAERTPGAVAVVDEDRSLTYAELNARANRLAHHLRAMGVGPDARVAILVPRSTELVVCELAILKAGAAYVPIDPAFPAERIAFMVADSGAPLVLSRAGDDLPALAGVERVDVDALSEGPCHDPGVPVDGGATAYVMYTSGSTGEPKGVVVPHRAIARLVFNNGYADFRADDRVAFAANPAFDATTMEVWGPLLHGGRTVVIPREVLLDADAFARTLAGQQVTTLFITTAVFNQYAQAIPGALANLRRLLTGGEAADPSSFARVLAENGPVSLIHCYGPTETTTFAITHEVTDVEEGARSIPLGRPIANTRIYLLDAHGEPVPVGVAGELHIGGPGVALGYLDRPGLTGGRFVPDPSGGTPGARMYRTGDLGRWLPDGAIEFLGRNDFQVKVRGFRIELGEVEARLLAHPEVREAVVLAREDAPGDRRLVAYYVGGEGAEAEQLRSHLSEQLPEYMVPAAFMRLEALPLTPNGKVDRRALPAPELASAENLYVAPRTPVEEVLAGVWAEVLRLERVGVEDSFFELGGHSLLATRMVSRIREVFAVELPLRALFEGPTVAALAKAVEEMRRAELPMLPPVVPAGRTAPLPLSFAQERLWFIDRLEPGSAAYNIPVARRLAGALDVAALERSLGEIVQRHESLRTVFAEAAGSPVQVVAPFGGFALPVEDLSGLGEADREAEVRRRAGDEARRPFDLSAGPLFRAALLRLDYEEHVLLLSMHHIVSDGWSMGVFFRELSALYAAYREGRESPLPELGVQYADYAAWQREHLRDDVLERQLGYWRGRLADAPARLELPTDRPHPAVQTFRGASAPVALSPELLERLQGLGRSEGTTLYMTLLAAFQVLLGRYAGSDDVVVGSPIAGRTRGEVEELIGFFVNTLVLRTDLSGDPGFREVLGRVREATLGAYAHQEVPFERLVAELQPERSLSHAPLFQVMFALQDAENGSGALAGLEVSGVGAAREIATFDLSLALAPTPRGLRGSLNYSTDLFERGTVERMLGHLERVLEQVAADADVRLSRLELLGEAERALVLEGWNRTDAEYPAASCIHELFEQQVERTPNAVAIVYEGEALRYAELNALANRLAHHLRSRGVGPDARVALCVERGVEMVAAVLAVLKAGGAYVPLDPEYPEERLGYMLQDSAPVVLLTQRSLAGRFDGAGVPIEVLDGDACAWTGQPDSNPGRGGLTPENLAYVIYTSGSTGQPKGVMNGHRAVLNLLAWGERHWELGGADAVLQRTSLSFDVSVRELFSPLLAGARLVVVRPGGQREVDYLVEVVRRQDVSTMVLTVSHMQAFLEHPGLEGCSSLRRIVLGGESIPAGMLAELRARLPGARVYHEYGPTEATVVATVRSCGAEGEASGGSIGAPISNTRVYLLDARGEPVPVGVPGELYVGGAGVARGYLGRPALTAERFVPHSFGAAPGARLYRTGDLGRWLPDGTIEFLGRVDTQVKVRGYRIEPGEIEARLLEREGVSEAVVVAREDGAGNRRLVAYVVGDVQAGELREHLRRELPGYMVPAAFVPMERLPLTPSGKLDRKALPAPELASAEDRYVAPRTPAEEVLAGIWAEVLRLERVGVEESFFELGGHSLLATRVVSRVRELFGVELPLRALFEGPTVAELAGRVQEIRRAGVPLLPPVVPAGRTGPLPLSFAQERLWFIDRLEPGSATYTIPAAWRLGGALDEAALERALGEIVRRHESLRTVFAEADDSPVQVIAPFGGFTLPVEDLSALGEAEREAAVRRLAGEEARRPFDLSAGPLFRAALLRLGDEAHVLLISMHHIVSDGWSMGVFFREMSALYAAYREGRESPLSELPVQYADYAVWQREQLAGEVLDRQLAYWRERLAGAPELLELPADHPRPPVQTFRGATVPVALSPELLERLQALGRSEGATLYMVALAAFQVLLSRYSGSDDVVVGSPIAGRTRNEIEELIGFFVNTLVLRTDLSGDPSFRETLRRVREATLGAYAHQEVPFEKLVAELQPGRSLSHSPLFQVMFTLENAEDGGAALQEVSVSGFGAELGSAKFDLSLALAATPQGLRGGLNYSTELFERGTTLRMLGHLERVLEQVAADADVRLSRLELLSAEERGLVVEEWNRTEAEPPDVPFIHESFAAQAARTPEALAVRFGDESLTYAELNERADRLAHSLRRRGVGPEVRVALLLERDAGAVVALLAVLKAGGAYVPLDPDYPPERLAFMLSDSGARVLLTRSGLVERLPAEGVETVCLDGDHGDDGDSAAAPRVALSPENLAYVIYTSGSTGTPKGVLVPHGGVANLIGAARERFGTGPRSRVLQAASLSFDASVLEIFLALTSGAALHGADRATLLAPGALAEQVRHAEIDTWIAVPALLDTLVPEEVPTLRTLSVGGDRCGAETAARWAPGRALFNVYAPTEATIFATLHRVDGSQAPPIGRPVRNLRAYVLDAAGSPAPLGVPGELYLGGAGVVRGYHARPGLTAERFVPDPFSGAPGARLYRSGDRARWRADGELEFLGRVDFQVKVRGFRIELGEIEAVLRRHEGVDDCVVIARADPGGQRLVAYVAGEARAEALRAHLRRSLPEYMVPSAIVTLDALPLTPNGKLDRKALPAPELASAEDRYVAPRTPVEEVLAETWAELLRLERVGVEESFFDLGGHSLLATRVVSRVREAFGVEMPLRALFEGPTVAELAVRVEEMRRAGMPVLPPVVPAGRTGPLPLSFGQERLWFLDRMAPGSTIYNLPGAWRLGGALDEGVLERALGEIVRRHETLRTVFGEVDGSPVQVVAPFGGFALPVEDLSTLDEGEREAALRRRAREEAARPFDLAAGPLFRAMLLRVGPDDHVLLLSMHHVVSDGWSMGVLFRELSALYEAYRDGRESPLPELAVQYADYAVWQREQLAGEVLDRQMAYWNLRLAGAPELLELPADHPRPAVQTYRGATVPVELSLELLERLQALGRSEGATLYMTLLAGFQVLLSKYAGSDDVVVGSPIAGRTRGEVEGLIGLFINTLVLRTDLAGDPTFRETLRRVRETTLGAYAHQEVPFEKLVAELQPERSLSHSPLFQVLFTVQNAGAGGGALPGVAVSGVDAELAGARFDLNLALTATAQGLRGALNYSTDLFERGTIDRMLRHLEQVLEQVAADGDVRLSRLELFSAEERGLVVEAWNRTGAEYPAERCIHELIEAQAARTPGAVAVVFEDRSLTYAELDARANRLAHHLAGLGAGPEARVGICVDRSAEMVVAMLAVLKAGAAYLPLDPSYPADRLAYMLQDSGAPLLVTQGSLRGLLPAEGVRIVSVDEDAAAIAANSADAPRTRVDAANAAYVIYTSGSTGRPKGVQVTHGNAVSFFAGMDERVGGPAAGTWLAVTRISFDIHVLELLWTLARGFRVVVQPEPDRAREGESIAEQIRRHAVTHLQCTPSLAAMMIAESGTGALSGLERILLGGEALPPDLGAQITAVLPNGLVNMYGPTETTVWSATHAVEAAEGPVPIGRPIANTRVYVLDAALRPQPAGVPGELFIGGHGVTRGYLGRPGLTAERFVPDAFSAQPGARLYRTGDRARWTERTDALTHSRTHALEYLGRLDEQVKVRGFRIEPGEIEAVLRRHPGVVECAVVARTAAAGDTRLVAYVVGAAEAEALRAHVGRSLPEYMVPGAFVPLDALPLTPNGKLDRKALPAPEGSSYPARVYEAPRTEAERTVAAVWAEVLGVKDVGAHDRFFDLGGHSLLLVRVQARLREAFGQPVPITHLFRYLTVSALAAALGAPAPEPAATPADDARVRDGRHRLRARAGRAGVNG